MITNISLTTVYCLDQEKARDFYVDVLGFERRADVTMGDDFRWLTVGHPSQPELEVTLMKPGPPLDPDAAEFVTNQLLKGKVAVPRRSQARHPRCRGRTGVRARVRAPRHRCGGRALV